MYSKKLKFADWLLEFNTGTLDTELVDAKGLTTAFPKAEKAVDLVRSYDAAEGEHKWLKDYLKWEGPRGDFGYLLNVGVIAPLSGSAYGLFNSGENQRILDRDIMKPGITFKTMQPISPDDMRQKDFLKNLSYQVIRQEYPDVDVNKIHDSAMIHVNVPKIINDLKLRGLKDRDLEKEIIKQIASTIVHEATHQLEAVWLKDKKGEGVPEQAEKKFADWLSRNPQLLDMAAS